MTVFTVTGKQLQNCNIRRFALVIMALRPALVISHTHSLNSRSLSDQGYILEHTTELIIN